MSSVDLKVAAFMTAPRCEITWARNVVDAAFKNAGIPLVISGGVFYGQCMQRMLTDAIEAGVDLAVTVDFDSIFTASDVKALIQTAVSHDYMDAVCALQSRRGSPYPLFTVGDNVNKVEFQGKPLRVSTAHFGLTAIKLDKLKDIPRPWFWSTPDENGDWSDAKVDDDIYFWRKWHEYGRSVYCDSSVSIGHLEELVACFDENGTHKLVYPNDWYDENLKP